MNAVILAIEVACANKITHLRIHTDNMFVIKTAKYYIKNWRLNGWKKADGTLVANLQDIKKLDKMCQKINIQWVYVKGHSNDIGNDAADTLAKLITMKPKK